MGATDQSTILLTGATGYVGGLVATILLANEHCRIVAPIRSGRSREALLATIKAELAAQHLPADIDLARLITITLPPVDDLESLLPSLSELSVEEIVHCAGSVDYFNSALLKEANIDMTSKLIWLGKQLAVRRFIYVSTAFSSGYTDGLVQETLHAEPEADPTEYTCSKREAEALVATSALPFLILRPSIIIGDSHDGHYSGKPYGLYQFWTAYEKFLSDRYRTELHMIAPTSKLQVIHQDAFMAAFLAAYRHVPADSIMHLVSRHETLPTVREVTHMWNVLCTRPSQVHYYNRLTDVPSEGLERRMRTWLEFTSVNGEIAAHPWHFQTTILQRLRAEGLNFKDATLSSIRICQERFVAQSSRLQAFTAKIEQPPGTDPKVFAS